MSSRCHILNELLYISMMVECALVENNQWPAKASLQGGNFLFICLDTTRSPVNLNLVEKKKLRKMSNGKIPKIKCRKVNMSKEKNVEKEKYRKSVLPTIKRKYIVVLFLLKIFYFTMRKLEGEGVGDIWSRLTFTFTLKLLLQTSRLS